MNNEVYTKVFTQREWLVFYMNDAADTLTKRVLDLGYYTSIYNKDANHTIFTDEGPVKIAHVIERTKQAIEKSKIVLDYRKSILELEDEALTAFFSDANIAELVKPLPEPEVTATPDMSFATTTVDNANEKTNDSAIAPDAPTTVDGASTLPTTPTEPDTVPEATATPTAEVSAQNDVTPTADTTVAPADNIQA